MRKHASFFLIVCMLLIYSTIPGSLSKSDGKIDYNGIYDLGYTYQSADENMYQEDSMDTPGFLFRTSKSVVEIYRIELEVDLSTNLSGITLDNGKLLIAFELDNGDLLIFGD